MAYTVSLRHGDVFSDDPDPALLPAESKVVLSAVAVVGRAVDARRPAR